MSKKTSSEFKFYVIGAGLPRTGTYTLKQALEILLPGKCMHMISIQQEQNFAPLMNHVFNENSSDEEFKRYFEKYNIVAGVDAPFNSVYKRAMKVFPDAKVVLTVRDPESWANSMKKTVCVAQRHSKRDKFPLSIINMLSPSCLRFRNFILKEPILNEAVDKVLEEDGASYFNDWVDDVKKTVPPERLLIYQVKGGWEPLCNFLDLPIPKQPFPKSNDKQEFDKIFQRLDRIAWVKFIALISIPIGLGMAYYKRETVVVIANKCINGINNFIRLS